MNYFVSLGIFFARDAGHIGSKITANVRHFKWGNLKVKTKSHVEHFSGTRSLFKNDCEAEATRAARSMKLLFLAIGI